MADFEEKIKAFAIDSEEKLLDVARTAIQSVIAEAQSEGGKMPVDTGFLRWSGVASLNSMPAGEPRGRRRKAGENGPLPEYAKIDGTILAKVLKNMKLGDTFYFGWTARYAKHQEARRAFLATAVSNFRTYVRQAVEEFSK